MALFLFAAALLAIGSVVFIGRPLFRRDKRSAGSASSSAGAGGVSRTGRLAAIAALGLVPLATAYVYLRVGAPEAFKEESRTTARETDAGAAEAIASLEGRVQSSPDDFAAWSLLGEAYVASGRFDDAVRAYERLVGLKSDDANSHAALGEALVLKADGAVTDAARSAFRRALDLAPDDARARYYLAESRFQLGSVREALKAWAGLLNDAPIDAPWFGAVAARLDAEAARAGVSLDDLGLNAVAVARLRRAETSASPASDASPDDAAAAIGAMPEDERRAMIEGMVRNLSDRLRADPENPEGWRMLARSYRVLNQPADSAVAWKEFMQRGAPEADDWRQYALALMEMRPQGDETVNAELEAALTRLTDLDSDDPLALYGLGQAARNRGDTARALDYWRRLKAATPPDSPYAGLVDRLIDETK